MKAPSSSGQHLGSMEAESNSSAEPPPGGSSHILPAMATVAAVAATNDPSRTEGDAAKDLDRDDKGQREGDIPPQKGEGPGYEGGNGQSAQEHSLEKPSSVTDSNNSDGGCSAGAKSYCGVASGRMYNLSKSNSDTHKSMGTKEGWARLLDSDGDGNNDKGHTDRMKDMDDISAGDKQSAEGEGESKKEIFWDETKYESLAKDDGLSIEEVAKEDNGQRRNYLPPAPEVFEADCGSGGGKAMSKMNGDHIYTHFGPDVKIQADSSQLGAHPFPADAQEKGMDTDAGLDHELRMSMELAGLGYSEKALEDSEKATFMVLSVDGLVEKVPPMPPRSRNDETLTKDDVISGASRASKEVGPETVAAPGPRDEDFAPDGVVDRVLLESEGPRPEVVAAPGPNEELSGMVALSSPRGMISLDVRFPMEGQNLDEASAGGGVRGDAAQQMPIATPGAVAMPGPMLDIPTNSDHHGENGSDYATATPFAANVVVEEGILGQARQRGNNTNIQGPVLDPNEVVYEGIKVAKDKQGGCLWNHLSHYRWMSRLSLLVICVAVAIGVPLARERRQDGTAIDSADASSSATFNPSVNPTLKPSMGPTTSMAPSSRYSAIKTAIVKAAENFSISTTAEALKDEESPQRKALEWLVLEDEQILDFDNTKSLVQRFVLASFYFATGGNESWYEQHNFLTRVQLEG
mmetsp:Transcript_13304/g.24806  ORF Transcript_13304/g.24806 Transcript_13304/m.24806 type:complete len:690 (-) Transcript_13304:702-2771(-)